MLHLSILHISTGSCLCLPLTSVGVKGEHRLCFFECLYILVGGVWGIVTETAQIFFTRLHAAGGLFSVDHGILLTVLLQGLLPLKDAGDKHRQIKKDKNAFLKDLFPSYLYKNLDLHLTVQNKTAPQILHDAVSTELQIK